MVVQWILFAGLALVAVASAIGMLLSKSAIYSALNLIINFVTVAAFYLILDAPFISSGPGYRVCRRDHGAVPVCDHVVGRSAPARWRCNEMAETPGCGVGRCACGGDLVISTWSPGLAVSSRLVRWEGGFGSPQAIRRQTALQHLSAAFSRRSRSYCWSPWSERLSLPAATHRPL